MLCVYGIYAGATEARSSLQPQTCRRLAQDILTNRWIWLNGTLRFLHENMIPSSSVSLQTLGAEQLRKYATRPLRFLHRLQNGGDFANMPKESFRLKLPDNSEGFRANDKVELLCGRWAIDLAKLPPSKSFGRMAALFMCWDISNVSSDHGHDIEPVSVLELPDIQAPWLQGVEYHEPTDTIYIFIAGVQWNENTM